MKLECELQLDPLVAVLPQYAGLFDQRIRGYAVSILKEIAMDIEKGIGMKKIYKVFDDDKIRVTGTVTYNK